MKSRPAEPPPAFELSAFLSLPGGKEAADRVDPHALTPIIITGLKVLAEHPDVRLGSDEVDRLAYDLLERVRDVRVGPFDRRVMDELQANTPSPVGTIRDILKTLLRAGSLEATLTQQRDSINQQLEWLARRRGAQ